MRGKTTEGLRWLLERFFLAEVGETAQFDERHSHGCWICRAAWEMQTASEDIDRKRKMGWKTLVESTVLLKTMEQG